jgi:hypothetical protein
VRPPLGGMVDGAERVEDERIIQTRP